MTPELIGILSVGVALGGLNLGVAAWLRADIRALRTEVQTDMRDLRTELRADMQDLRADVRADMQDLRTEVRADIQHLRADVHGLDQRTSRIEGVIEGLFVGMNGRGRATSRDAGQERGEEAA